MYSNRNTSYPFSYLMTHVPNGAPHKVSIRIRDLLSPQR